MAENKDTHPSEDMQKSIANYPLKGLNTDFSNYNAPKGSWTFALNSVLQDINGNSTALSNEGSTIDCTALNNLISTLSSTNNTKYVIIGTVEISNNNSIIFLAPKITVGNPPSVIVKVNKDCSTATVIAEEECLNFSVEHPIHAISRVRRGCMDMIYFVDGYNPNRALDVTEPYTTLDCDSIKLQQDIDYPTFSNIQVIDSGGSVDSGLYRFAIKYIDDDFNETNWLFVSNPVSIYYTKESSYNKIVGNYNESVDPTNGYPAANKSIKIELTNLDTRYKYYKIAVIKNTDATGIINQVVVSDKNIISSITDEFIYTGDTSAYTDTTITDIQTNVSVMDTAKSITQFDSHLILGNVAESNIDYCSLQRDYASKIAVNYVGKVENVGNQGYDADPKNPTVYFDFDEYMAGEVYALGIVYTFPNGNLSPVYHIPGRPKNQYWYGSGANNIAGSPDTLLIPASDDTTFVDGNANPNYEQYKIYDTSGIITGTDDTDEEGYMWYYQLENTVYEKQKCGLSDDDYWGQDFATNNLEGTPVRHHRMPSRAKVKALITSTLYEHCLSIEGDWTVDTNDIYTIQVDYDKYDCNGLIGSFTYTTDIDATSDLSGTLPKEFIECVTLECDSSTVIFQNIVVTATSSGGIGTMTAFPTTSEEIIISSGILKKKLIGLKFYNVEIPTEANGYFFVRAIRNNANKLVYQRGMIDFNSAIHDKDGTYISNQNIVFPGISNFNYVENETSAANIYRNIISFESPEIVFNKELSGSYFRLEYKQEIQGSVSYFSTQYGNTWGNHKDSVFNLASAYYNSPSSMYGNLTLQRVIDSKIVLERLKKSSNFYSGKDAINASQSKSIGVLKLDHTILTPSSTIDGFIYYGSLMDCKDVYSNLYSLEYINISNGVYHNEVTGFNNIEEFGGDCKLNFERGINNIILGVTHSSDDLAKRGDEDYGIYQDYNRDSSANKDNWLSNIITSGFNYNSSSVDLDANSVWLTIINTYMHYESPINLGLRIKPKANYDSWYDYFSPSNYNDYVEQFILYKNSSGDYVESYVGGNPEYYEYNNDYTEADYAKKYYPISDVYDCCLSCSNSHPHRVVWSEKSFEEEINDNYKVILPESYKDIKGDTGVITNVFVFNNKLYVHAEKQLYVFPKPIQEKITDELTTYIGTGEFLSFGPFEVSSHTGSKDSFATIISNAGLFFVNREDNMIYLINDKINMISLLGLNSFFMDNLQFDNDAEYNPFMGDGLGYVAGYDEELARILLTKYNLIPNFEYDIYSEDIFNILPSLAGYYYCTLYHTYYYYDGVGLTELLFDSDNFICDVWTLSYSLAYNFWISYHSYTPNGYFNIGNKIYSFTSQDISKSYLHNDLTNYLNLYDTEKSFIVEQIISESPYITSMVDNVIYDTIALNWNNVTESFVEDRYTTFNSIILYNSKQCTGQLTLIPKEENPSATWMEEQVINTNGVAQASRLERNWFINNFNDYIIDYSQPYFIKNGLNNNVNDYIDKIINPAAINFTKSWEDLQPLRDKFVYVRMIYQPDQEETKKLIYNFMVTNTTKSIR